MKRRSRKSLVRAAKQKTGGRYRKASRKRTSGKVHSKLKRQTIQGVPVYRYSFNNGLPPEHRRADHLCRAHGMSALGFKDGHGKRIVCYKNVKGTGQRVYRVI